jgi:hypothetical protein
MVQLYKVYPYHYASFSSLSGGISKAAEKFEVDYWNMTAKSALHLISSKRSNENIRVYASISPFLFNQYRINNLIFSNLDEAVYAVCNRDIRWCETNLHLLNKNKTIQLQHTIMIDALPVSRIYSISE